ncbi:MAG TPA: prenyltransferase [Arenicellales bacterium]|nr:prenyltransferase [Arenicellales bacterium]
MKLAAAIQSMRIPFLVLTPASVFLGASTAAANHAAIQWHLLIPALIGGLLAHVSVNTLNEYLDFRSGLDLTTIRTPFSGGSGALPRNPEAAGLVLATGVASLALTLLIGIYFVLIHGAGIIPIGLLGFVLVVTYTPWVNRYPLLCLVAPGTGFGFLMVVGTQYVMEGAYRPLAWLAGLVPFFLVNNLLLLNQYPDIHADAGAGRRHFPIAYGLQRSNLVYGGSLLLAALVVLLGVATGWFPSASLAALAPMAPAIFALYGAVSYGSDIGRHPVYLAANVVTAILTPVVLGVSFLLG